MKEPSAEIDNIAREIVDAAFIVHRELGPGLLESVYEVCLADVLARKGLAFARQVPVPVVFGARTIEAGFRADMIVQNKVIVEIKSIEKLAGIHEAQILTYMKLSGLELGFLLNFNSILIKDGIKRLYRPAANVADVASWR